MKYEGDENSTHRHRTIRQQHHSPSRTEQGVRAKQTIRRRFVVTHHPRLDGVQLELIPKRIRPPAPQPVASSRWRLGGSASLQHLQLGVDVHERRRARRIASIYFYWFAYTLVNACRAHVRARRRHPPRRVRAKLRRPGATVRERRRPRRQLRRLYSSACEHSVGFRLEVSRTRAAVRARCVRRNVWLSLPPGFRGMSVQVDIGRRRRGEVWDCFDSMKK